MGVESCFVERHCYLSKKIKLKYLKGKKNYEILSLFGGQLEDVAQVCVHCGAYVENRQSASSTSSEANKPNAGYNILAFFFPIVGLVLWAVWKSKYPLRAKEIGK